MEIKLNLILSLIVEAVKAETYIKGTIDRSTGDNQSAANAMAYNETIGDEDLHERKIMRSIYTSADKLRSYIQDYIIEDTASVGSNVVLNINKNTDSITIILNANNRFRNSNADSLARLFSKYIEDQTLVLWWTAVGSQSQIQYYTTLANEDMTAIQRLFTKSAPGAVAIPYTSKILCKAFGGSLAKNTAISLVIGEETTITYTIDDNVIDDVNIVSDSRNISMSRDASNNIVIKGIHTGIAMVTLYSLHDETVYASITVNVTTEDGNDEYYQDSHRHPFPPMY